ncbi:MAG TPA: hypothetical protein VGM20_10380 [Gemmatimonadales bacterium]
MKRRRAGLAALTLAAVLLPLWHRTRPVDSADARIVDRSAELESLEAREYDAVGRWTQLAQRDSALAYLDRLQPTGPAPQLVMQGYPATIATTDLQAMVTSLWARIGAVDTSLHVAVIVQNDSLNQVARFSWGWYQGAVFATRGRTRWCLAVLSGYYRGGKVSVSDGAFELATAPCILNAAFGPPGKAVQQWLTATRYQGARSNHWLVPGPDEFGPWDMMRSSMRPDLPRNAFFTIAEETGTLDLAGLLRPPYEYGADGVRCLDGDTRSCSTMVLHPAVTTWPDARIPTDITLERSSPVDPTVTFATVRGPRPTLVAGLISQYGRERFQRFWSSEQPIEVAFQEAFGESLGTGVARWAHGEWLKTRDAEFRSATILTGATLRPSWVILLTLYSGLAVLISTAVARRRHV